MVMRVARLYFCAILWWSVPDEVDGLSVHFFNKMSKPLEVYFVHPDHPSSPEYKDTIEAGFHNGQDTWVGHVFEIRVEGATPQRVEVKGGGNVGCSLSKDNRLELHTEWNNQRDEWAQTYVGQKWDAVVSEAENRCQEIYAGYPDDSAHFCKHDTAFSVDNAALRSRFDIDDGTWKVMFDEEDVKRRNFMETQPETLHKFTKVGFKVLDIPADLLRELRELWFSGRKRDSTLENHPHLDPNLSCRQSETWILQLPAEVKQRIVDTLAPIIASWANVDVNKLQSTATYGIRLYKKDAVLHKHVDRRDTHVLSAILEVGYLGFTTPGVDEGDDHAESWPLDITDHSGNDHYVANRPGQIILYESATCPHGRPTRFPGRESANIFVHFAPVGWPQDFIVNKNEL